VLSPDGQTLFYRADGPVLEARSVADGVRRWSVPGAGPHGLEQLVAGSDAVYDVATPGGVTALATGSGTVLWRYSGEGLQWGASAGDTFYITSRLPDPATAGADTPKVIDTVYALDAHTGATRWTYQAFGRIAATPDVVLVRGDSDVYALRSADGSLVWRKPAQTWVFSPFTTFVGPVVYFAALERFPPEQVSLWGSTKGQTYLYALDTADGSLYWSAPVGPVATLGPHIVF
jgi:outer membrane protein assembly factor BamB